MPISPRPITPAGGRRNRVPDPARALSGRRSGLRRDLPASSSAISGTRGRCAAPPTAPACARAPRRREPDVTISTDAETWLALRQGEMSGIDAFERRPLSVTRQPRLRRRLRGDVPAPRRASAAPADPRRAGRPPPHLHADHGPRPRRPAPARTGRNPRLAVRRPPRRWASATASTRPTCPASAPPPSPRGRRYNARWYAETMLALHGRPGHLARARRRQLDGRPDRHRDGDDRARARPLAWASCARPWPGSSAAFTRWSACCDPSSACCPTASPATRSPSQFWSLFYDRDLHRPRGRRADGRRVPAHLPLGGARLAFLASARNIYLEAPYGRHGFYPRLAELQPPALFVWGTHDGLVPAAFGRHVRKWLPSAEQVTIEDCGHVPQVERPEETNELLTALLRPHRDGGRAGLGTPRRTSGGRQQPAASAA